MLCKDTQDWETLLSWLRILPPTLSFVIPSLVFFFLRLSSRGRTTETNGAPETVEILTGCSDVRKQLA